MSDEIVLNDPRYGPAIANAAGAEWGEKSTCIARVRDGWIVGGAVYQAFTHESIGMHVAGFEPRWLNRDLMWVGYHYPFVQLGVQRLFSQVPEDNLASQRLLLHAGWEPVVRVEGVYKGGVACLLMKMERAACRFLDWKPRTIKANFLEAA